MDVRKIRATIACGFSFSKQSAELEIGLQVLATASVDVTESPITQKREAAGIGS